MKKALFLLGIFALVLIGSMNTPVSSNEIDLSFIRPIKSFQVAAEIDEFIATAFTDSSGDWGSESNAYDGDWGTYADNVIFADGDDYPSAFANGFDNGASGSGAITQVDIIVRMSFASSSTSDEWGITLDVGASTGNVLWAMDKTPYSLANNTFTDVTEPNDSTWSWAEIQASEIHLDSNKVGGRDNDVWNVYEFCFKVTSEAGGTPYSKDLTETISVVDIQTNAASYDRSYTESIGAIDVQTNAADMARNFVESISAVGILAVLRGREKDLVETITVSDLRTFTIDYTRNLVETISISGIWSKEFGLNRTEAISVVDAGTFSKFIQKNMTEAIGVTDSMVRSAGYSREMTENITGVDLRTFSIDYTRNWLESINVVDIIDAQKSNGTDYEKNLIESIVVSPALVTVGGETALIGSMIYQIFFSLDMWGYIGPIALVIGGYIIAKHDKFLGLLWFVVEMLVIANYLGLVAETPEYWWQTYILLFGGFTTLIYSLRDRW